MEKDWSITRPPSQGFRPVPRSKTSSLAGAPPRQRKPVSTPAKPCRPKPHNPVRTSAAPRPGRLFRSAARIRTVERPTRRHPVPPTRRLNRYGPRRSVLRPRHCRNWCACPWPSSGSEGRCRGSAWHWWFRIPDGVERGIGAARGQSRGAFENVVCCVISSAPGSLGQGLAPAICAANKRALQGSAPSAPTPAATGRGEAPGRQIRARSSPNDGNSGKAARALCRRRPRSAANTRKRSRHKGQAETSRVSRGPASQAASARHCSRSG
jgi:hypothetical protein